MADPSTQSFIDNLITVIYNAEEPESVTNAMVARILSYFNSTIKDVQAQIKSTIEVQTINSGRIDSIIGDNTTKAIDNLNEIISFLLICQASACHALKIPSPSEVLPWYSKNTAPYGK